MENDQLRRFEGVCVLIAFKGSMNRQGYAWFTDPAKSRPDPPLFSRHVEFLRTSSELEEMKPWWRPEDVNRSVGPTKYLTSASDMKVPDKQSMRWLKGTSWWLDISHGGTPNLWKNICHWSNSMLPFFESAHLGHVCRRPLSQIIMWQVIKQTMVRGVPKADFLNTSYHHGLLGAVVKEYQQQWLKATGGTGPVPEPSLMFDGDIPAGTTFCFEEVIVVKEPNLQHRRLGLQTRSSMSSAGVARGFDSMETRLAFRKAVLSHLRVPAAPPRVPTITHLTRPMGNQDARLHGRAWQLRCHITAKTFRKLQGVLQKEAGYVLRRAVFERTTYAQQAEIISQTDIFWAGHGAGMVHLPLLPEGAVAVEMFNCGHFSYLYANLALRLRIKYFAMQRTEQYCYRPPTLYGDTRKNMSKTYEYKMHEVEPVLMQAVRYHMWQDLDPEQDGRGSKCEVAQRILATTGVLPLGVNLNKWVSDCVPGIGEDEAARKVRETSKLWKAPDPAKGSGKPGQYTRWAGVG